MKKRIFSAFIAGVMTLCFGVGTAYATDGFDVYTETVETVPYNALDDGVQSGASVENVYSSEDATDAGNGIYISTVPTVPVKSGEVMKGTFRTTPTGEETEEEPVYGMDDFVLDESFYDDIYFLSDETTGVGYVLDDTAFRLRDKDVVAMVMPVIPEHMFDFIMDPDNLLSRFSGDSDQYEPSSLYFKRFYDEKRYGGISDTAIAVNKSSVPVLLSVSLQIENPNGLPLNYTMMQDLDRDDQNNLSFSIVPVRVNDEGEKVLYTDGGISVDEKGYAEFTMLLDGTQDNFIPVDDMLMPREDASWSAGGFAIRGACNTLADWSSLIGDDNEVVIRVTYSMTELNDEQKFLLESGLEPDPETMLIDFYSDDEETALEEAVDEEETEEELVEEEEFSEEEAVSDDADVPAEDIIADEAVNSEENAGSEENVDAGGDEAIDWNALLDQVNVYTETQEEDAEVEETADDASDAAVDAGTGEPYDSDYNSPEAPVNDMVTYDLNGAVVSD